MRTRRKIEIVLESTLTDEMYAAFLREVTEAVEQSSCDYAGACEDDHYSVEVVTSAGPVMTRQEIEEMIGEHMAAVADWAEGRRSWTNLGPHEPYTPDVIARMDAAEVDKHASAIRALAALLAAVS